MIDLLQSRTSATCHDIGTAPGLRSRFACRGDSVMQSDGADGSRGCSPSILVRPELVGVRNLPDCHALSVNLSNKQKDPCLGRRSQFRPLGLKCTVCAWAGTGRQDLLAALESGLCCGQSCTAPRTVDQQMSQSRGYVLYLIRKVSLWRISGMCIRRPRLHRILCEET